MSINQHERAYRMWNILADLASRKRDITYKDLAQQLGLHPRVLRYPLNLIQEYCLEQGLPPLTILAVNQSGFPGQGFTAVDHSLNSLRAGRLEVFSKNDWREEGNPFAFAATGASFDRLVSTVLKRSSDTGDLLAVVKTRGIAQQIFRAGLLDAYRRRCAFSGSTVEQALEAAHIVPWSEASDQDRFHVSNGLLLNSFFHKLFDSDVLVVTPERIIEAGPTYAEAMLSPFDKHCIEPRLGQRILLPSHKDYFPDRALLARRYELAMEKMP
jgi:putative restriction endonuclease